MSKPLKPRRGTTAEQNAFVGEAYEVTYDTDKNTLVCRDGATPGGFPLAKEGSVFALETMLRTLIAQELAKKLSLSGGTMTGAVRQSISDFIFSTSDDKWTSIKGGSAYGKGGEITLYGQDHPTAPGFVSIQATKEGATTTSVNIEPGKKVFINGYSVITAAGGTMVGDLHGNHYNFLSQFAGVELSPPSNAGHGGHIDFHFNGDDSKDWTSRIIETASGLIDIQTPSGVRANNCPIIALEAFGDGYLRYSDGTQITMQNLGVTSSGGTYTLPIPFKDAAYFFMPCVLGFSDANHNITCTAIDGASFKARANGGALGCQVVCIGRWK